MSRAERVLPALVLLLLIGCGERPAAPGDAAVEDAAVEDAALDAAVVDAPAAPPPRRSAIALASDEAAWGVVIPIGCTPVFARADWIECRCRLSIDALRRYFAFRFPAGRLTALGRGHRFDPGTTVTGHAVLLPFAGRDGVRSRLLLFAGDAIGDPAAAAIINRLVPAAQRE